MTGKTCGGCIYYSGHMLSECQAPLPWWTEPYQRPRIFLSEGWNCPIWNDGKGTTTSDLWEALDKAKETNEAILHAEQNPHNDRAQQNAGDLVNEFRKLAPLK